MCFMTYCSVCLHQDVGLEYKLQLFLLVLNSQCFSSSQYPENTVVIVEGYFMGAITTDGGVEMISTSVFRTAGLDSHIIIFNKEALFDVYLQLTRIVFHNYHKINK